MYISADSVQGFPFLKIIAIFFICVHFDDSHSDLSEVVSYCVLIYISLMISDAEYISCACWSFIFPVWINVDSVLLMFSSRSFIVSDLTFRFLIYFEFLFLHGITDICK